MIEKNNIIKLMSEEQFVEYGKQLRKEYGEQYENELKVKSIQRIEYREIIKLR